VSRENDHWATRLPFYYGWVIIGVAFVTMAIGVTARTSFSLLLPPLIDEFGWTAGVSRGRLQNGGFARVVCRRATKFPCVAPS
jgi:hypothetical protein